LHKKLYSLPENAPGIRPQDNFEGADNNDRAESHALHRREHKARINKIEQGNKDKETNRRLRWKYAKLVYCYLVSYSAFVALITFLCGFNLLRLPGNVLLALVSSTCVSAIGLVGLVVSGLFKA
jgi:hypothetical protein